ncbi:hypothetical protein H0H92_012009 [Tricholoma furcatifolium]|nr:hypothetical protein H0H92_012009 [Tricholoma furcatifolium]
MANGNWGDDLRRNVRSYLETLSHGATPFITTFLLIHLTAPAIATLGGSSLSSQTMTSFGEKYLLLAPLAVHAISGTAIRLLSPEPSKRPRPLKSLMSIAGYSTLLCFLPIHFMTHRVHPTTLDAPISAVGPSELDYEFVKTGLRRWPRLSWMLYGGLILSAAAHVTEGVAILWGSYSGTSNGRAGSVQRRRAALRIGASVGLVLPVLAGLYVLSNEPSMIFSATANRYEASFMQSWLYRLSI